MRRSGTRTFILLATVLPLLTGCATLGARTPHVTGVTDTIFYVSARARDGGNDTHELASGLEYGMAMVHRHRRTPDDGGITRDIADSLRLDSLAFVSALRTRLLQQPAPFDFAVLYVHGMGTSLHEAWQHTAAARTNAGGDIPWIVFCWPSIGAGLTWPARNAVFTAAYRRDSVMADSARQAFAVALGVIRDGVSSAQLVLASHSLGGQLVGESLRTDEAIRRPLLAAPLRAVAFLMPDVPAERLRDTIAPTLPDIAARRVLYVSRRDRVLAVARMIRRSERGGLRTDTTWLPPDRSLMETVDVSDATTDEGWFQRQFGTHHAMKRQVGLLLDLVHIVGAGRAVECREQLGVATTGASGIIQWQRGVAFRADSARFCPAYSSGRAP